MLQRFQPYTRKSYLLEVLLYFIPVKLLGLGLTKYIPFMSGEVDGCVIYIAIHESVYMEWVWQSSCRHLIKTNTKYHCATPLHIGLCCNTVHLSTATRYKLQCCRPYSINLPILTMETFSIFCMPVCAIDVLPIFHLLPY